MPRTLGYVWLGVCRLGRTARRSGGGWGRAGAATAAHGLRARRTGLTRRPSAAGGTLRTCARQHPLLNPRRYLASSILPPGLGVAGFGMAGLAPGLGAITGLPSADGP